MTNLTEKEKRNNKQYYREIIPAAVLYMVMIWTSLHFVEDMQGTIWVYPMILSPLIPVFFIIRSMVTYVRRCDELVRKLYGDSAVITLLITIFSGFAYGLLEHVGLPQPDIFLAASLICPLYFIVFAILRRKYGMTGCH